MKTKLHQLSYYIFFIVNLNVHSQSHEVSSPNGQLILSLFTTDQLAYSIKYLDKQLIEKSEISMTINQRQLGRSPKLKNSQKTDHDEIINPVVRLKSNQIRDQYQSIVFNFEDDYGVEFRVFNDGVAYRFISDFSRESIVNSELATFKFPDNTYSYFPEEESLISHYERVYKYTRLDTVTSGTFCSLPVLMDVEDVKVLITEADLYDYPGMFLYGSSSSKLVSGFPNYPLKIEPMKGSEDRNEVIIKEADYIAKTNGKRTFPWRVMVIGDDKTLLETNLVYQLSRPLQLKNTDWIKPGKVAWDWYNANNIYGVDFLSGDNTETYKYYIDFASKYGIEYVILDEGWSKTTTNILESNPDIDIPELVSYGKSKKVDLILWSLWKPVNDHLEEVLKTYSDWGIKGIKIDFMQRADQLMVNYYEKVVAAAAEYELLIDYHGAYKPSGLRRAYPNLISYEGVKGNENNKWSRDVSPDHTTTLPFTRMVAGPMDFTPGAMINAQDRNFQIIFDRPMSLGTRCHQVAMYVVFESPLQMLCDAPSTYYKEVETTEFIAKMPTEWDETVALEAKVGDYLLMARRNGDTWYVGGMNDWSPRELNLDFSFLPAGNYRIEWMQDGVNAHRYAQDYVMKTGTVRSGDNWLIKFAPGGGWAAIITKN